MSKPENNVDSEKRGKMLLLAALIALAIFIFKISQSQEQQLIWRTSLNSFIYFLIAFVGLLWAFNYQVKKKSFVYIFQASLFVFSEALFIEFFFFQKFDRIYEAVILLVLILAVFLLNYFTFLTANVLNVNLFKSIPLVQVGRTISYVISVFMIYFFTFSILVSGIPVYFAFPLILFIYFIVSILHYINVGVEGAELVRKSVITVVISTILLVGVALAGNIHEVISLAPVIGYYLSVYMVTREKMFAGRIQNDSFLLVFLVILLIVIFFLNI